MFQNSIFLNAGCVEVQHMSRVSRSGQHAMSHGGPYRISQSSLPTRTANSTLLLIQKLINQTCKIRENWIASCRAKTVGNCDCTELQLGFSNQRFSELRHGALGCQGIIRTSTGSDLDAETERILECRNLQQQHHQQYLHQNCDHHLLHHWDNGDGDHEGEHNHDHDHDHDDIGDDLVDAEDEYEMAMRMRRRRIEDEDEDDNLIIAAP